MGQKETTIPTYDGREAEVQFLENADDGRRLKVTGPDDREWVVRLELPGGRLNVEVTRVDGSPADLETPEWLEDNLSQMAQPV